MQFFAFNLDNFKPEKLIYTATARNARDKYQVCSTVVLVQGMLLILASLSIVLNPRTRGEEGLF